MPFVLTAPPFLQSRFIEAKQAPFDQERTALIQAGIHASENVPGAEKRSNKRSSELAALKGCSALRTTRYPRLALAGVIATEQMLNYGRYAGSSTEVRAGMILRWCDELIVSHPEHMMENYCWCIGICFRWKGD